MSVFRLAQVSITTQGKTVVKAFDLELQSGALVVLMGANGSGKSSLLNGIFGHPKYTQTGGHITIDDEDVTQFVTEEKARKGLFLSMQHLPSISGVTLVNFLHRVAKELYGHVEDPLVFHERLASIATRFGLDKGLLLREVHVGLSGGEKKQAELLQLLALRPKFAFLDEIDAGMDIDTQKKLHIVLDHLRAEGMGVLLVSHHVHTLGALKPDQVIVLENGSIKEVGGEALIERILVQGFNGLIE